MAGKREQQMKEITERLEQGVKELFTSEQYTEYLKTMSQFHNYSFNNTLLIAMQKPDATLVAGYQAWQKKFKRQVKRGEKGIQIISPAPIREKEEVEKFDPETNEPILRPDGQPETEEVVHTIPRFRVATVFDVSQTEGEPLPELDTPELMGSVENFEIFMQAVREISSVPLRFDEIESGAKGYYSNVNKEIVIQEGMSESQTMKTAVHETVHAKLHDRDIMDEMGEKKNQMTKEVEAESVAYTVCQYFGLDTSDYSFPYIAGWSSSMDMKELRTSMDVIRKTAGELTSGMTDVIQRLMREQPEKEHLEEDERMNLSSELTAMGQAELLIQQAEHEGTVFNDDERNLIMNYAFKFDNMEDTRALIRELKEAIEAPDVREAYEVREHAQAEIDSLPDGMIGLSEMHQYGYYDESVLPLTMGRAVELHHAGEHIYSLHQDGSRTLMNTELDILEAGGLFGIEAREWERYRVMESAHKEHESKNSDEKNQEAGHDREELLLNSTGNRYEIYQLNRNSKGEAYRFMNMDFVKQQGMTVDGADYQFVYGDVLTEQDTLESLFYKFNEERPEDFSGHSLSVSDVVAIQKGGVITAYYVDSVGFVELPDFMRQREERAEQEKATVARESDYQADTRVTDHTVGLEVEGHTGGWHTKEVREYAGENFYLMESDQYMDSVAGIIVNADGELVAEDLWNGFNQDALEVIEDYLEDKGIHEAGLVPDRWNVYPHPVSYAIEHDEIGTYQSSMRKNIACRHAIERAIHDNFDGMHLSHDAAKSVIKEYKAERVAYVLANTVQLNDHDGRFSRENKEWAKTIPVTEDIDQFGTDKRIEFGVSSHPAVLDGFIGLARQEIRELEKETQQDVEQPFISRYYVVNDAYGVKAEREYQYFPDFDSAVTAYNKLPNHMDKEIGMESTEQPPSRMSLIKCRNGMEAVEDVKEASLSEKWMNPEVEEAGERAKKYLEFHDVEIAYWMEKTGDYLIFQTVSDGYDYTFYDGEYRELDGGVYDDLSISIGQALEMVLNEENIGMENCTVIDCDELREKIEAVEAEDMQKFQQDKAKETTMLTDAQADVLDKIAHGSGMDCWFSIGDDNSYIFDLEDNKRLSLTEGIQTLHEGMTSYQDYGMSAEEISIFEGLLSKLGIEPLTERVALTSNQTTQETALNGQSRAEIEEMVLCYAQAQIEEMGLKDEVKLLGARVYGSRTRSGLYQEDSDVDVVLSYTGNIREDDFFNALHEDGMKLAGMPLDINPISLEKAGTLGEYLERAEQYLDEKEVQNPVPDRTKAAAPEKEPGTEQEAKISFYVAECMEIPVLGEYHENLTLQEAVQKYEEIPAGRINGVKGIGFCLEDGSIYDGEYALMSGGGISRDAIDLVPHYKQSPLVQKAIADLEAILSQKQEQTPEKTTETEKPLSEGAGRKQSVLKALRERQAKLKEQAHTEKKEQAHKKGGQEL